MRFQYRSAALLAASLALAAGAAAQTLTIGSKAPAIQASKWVKGDEIKSFKKGKVYVMEFWATWCGPCIAAFPHLSELAKKHKGKVDFVGMNIWERGVSGDALTEKITKFVDSQGKNMGYNVAIEKSGQMAKTWMDASGQTGIPAAFIVGKTGEIEWIGHPMLLDEPLAQVVSGTYDRKAAIREIEREKKLMKVFMDLGPAIQEAMQSGDEEAAVAEIDDAIKANPDLAGDLGKGKMSIQMMFDVPGAMKTISQMVDGPYKNDANELNNLAWMIVGDEPPLKGADYKVGMKAAKRASNLTKNKDPMILDTLAMAHYQLKQYDKAIATQKKAISILKASKDKYPTQDVAEFTGRLAMFEKAKNRGA